MRIGRLVALPAGRVSEPLALLVVYLGYTGARLAIRPDEGVARDNGRAVLDLERLLHVDLEASANAWLAGHLGLAVVAAYWYAAMHFAVTPVVLVLLRRRVPWSTYRPLRDGLVVATLLALIGYALYPVMPPRLLGGFTDVMVQTAPYGWWKSAAGAPRGAGGLTNQFAAMPSMHVGWAVWCALAATAMLPRSRWRPLVWLYPLASLSVVVATANHYLLDGLVGGLLVVTCVAVARRRVS